MNEALIWCFIALFFSKSVVEVFGDYVAFALGDSRHGCSFRQILPDKTVGVLVGPALPAVMRSGEVELAGLIASTWPYHWNSVPLSAVMVRIRLR